MNWRLSIRSLGFVLVVSACSYAATPTISTSAFSGARNFPGAVNVSFSGTVDALDGKAVNKSGLTCAAHSYSIKMKDEFKNAVRKYLDSKFESGLRSATVTTENDLNVILDVRSFNLSFDHRNEAGTFWFGLLAGMPELVSSADLDMAISLKRNGQVFYSDTFQARSNYQIGFLTCNDIEGGIRRASELVAEKAILEIDRRISQAGKR